MSNELTQQDLQNILRVLTDRNGTDLQSAMRDVLTDLRHVAESSDLDFEVAVKGSGEVYKEEVELREPNVDDFAILEAVKFTGL